MESNEYDALRISKSAVELRMEVGEKMVFPVSSMAMVFRERGRLAHYSVVI